MFTSDPHIGRREMRRFQVVEVDNIGKQTPVTIVSAYNEMHALMVARHMGFDVEAVEEYAIIPYD